MTTKRFKYVEFTRNILSFDDNGVCKFFNEQEFEDWLNELNEENKKLKQVNEMLQMDFAMTERNLIEENEQLKSNVIDLIDKKINKLKNTNEVSLIPRESVEILKELKKELEE